MHIPGPAQMAVMSAFCLHRSRLQSTSSGKVFQRGEYTSQNSPVKNKLFLKFTFLESVHLDYPHDSGDTRDSGSQRTLSEAQCDGM